MKPFLLVVCLFHAGLAMAVTPGDGPGGVGTTDGSSELELWVKADTLALANGAAVATWEDSSGNGRALVQGNASARPVFASGVLNGLPVVRFTADYFNSLTLPSTGNAFAFVAVIKPTHTGAYHNIFDDEDSGRPMLWIDVVGNYEFSYNSGAVAPRGGGYDVVFAIKRNTPPQYSQLYLNGPAVTAGSAVNHTVAASEVYDFFNRDGGQAFHGDVAEMMVFSTALTTEEIEKIGYYLQTKYALPTAFPPLFAIFAGYETSPAVYGVGEAIAPNAPLLEGGPATGYSVLPPLPAGLTLDADTGVISGTPEEAVAPASYTISATLDGQEDVSAQLALEVTPPTLLGYTRDPAVFTRGRPGQAAWPILRGGPPTGFTISPPLPDGLALDPATGGIAGVPEAAAPASVHTVTASFSGQPDSGHDLTVEVLEASTTLEISEFMAANESGLVDGYGMRSDWIEIHNFGTDPIDLAGWSLTDNAGNPRKWVFPPHFLAPGAYLVVFASGEGIPDPDGNLHANFRLAAEGEYLALVEPDGIGIAREFSPAYPPQSDDVSYGTGDGVSFGYYMLSTPGAPNGFFDTVATLVTATPSGRTFSGSIAVTLAAPLAPGEVIRYTVNGTAPVASSTLYAGPVDIASNTRLQARVFKDALNPGPPISESYLRMGAGMDTFSSNLPLVFLHTDAAIAASGSPTLTGAGTVIVDVDAGSGRAASTGAANYSGRSGLRVRGRSSQSFPQKQYKFETRNGVDKETDAELLGMSLESDWVLYAPYTDKALVRNALAYGMWEAFGWPSLRTRFVEVFINDDQDGQFTYADDYAGVYMLVEAIRHERFDMRGPQSSGDPDGITGGYITETGASDDADFTTTSSGRTVGHKHADPGVEQLDATQRGWINDYLSDFERALYGANFTHPVNGRHYRTYTNMASQVDYRIAREWSRNFDGGSTYSNIPRGGQLAMGPLWDYNWAFGNVNYAEGGDLPGYRTDGWNRSFVNFGTWAPWWLRMEQDADWWQDFIDRWTTLREGVLGDAEVDARVDALTQPLAAEAAGRYFAKYPQLGQFTVISAPGWQTRTTYQSEVEYLKAWMRDRSAWIDAQFPPRPEFSLPPGGVAPGSILTLGAVPGDTIHYTLDGSDPRMPGGGINPAALNVPSGGGVTLDASAIVSARARRGTVWGAPRTGAFVTGTPAGAMNLVVTEIAYHPANPSSPEELAAIPPLSDDDFEFIELRNIGATTIDLTGAEFTEGIRFTFPPGSLLAPGEHLVLVENSLAFVLRYGDEIPVAGQYSGNLDNSGETLVLVDAGGAEVLRFRYDDQWTPAADGGGYSLVLRDPDQVPADYGEAAAWGLSSGVGGNPGSANGPVFTEDFALWRQGRFSAGELESDLISGPEADPDRDGYNNLAEFALASDPLDPGSFPQIEVAIGPVDIAFTVTRPRQGLGLEWRLESTLDFLLWDATIPVEEGVSETNATETLVLSAPHGSPSRAFWRIAITESE